MRKLQWILSLCLLSPAFWGQGFERSLPLDSLDAHINSIRLVKEGVLEIDYSPLFTSNFGKVWYYVEHDSLGEANLYSYMSYLDQVKLNDSIWLAYGTDYNSCEGRNYLNFKPLILGDWLGKYPTNHLLPFNSASFNMLLIEGEIYAYHDTKPCRSLSNNPIGQDTLFYYHVDLYQDQVTYLDTVVLPFNMRSPGSAIHDQKTGQNIIFYNNLKIYHTPFRGALDSVVIDSSLGSFESSDFPVYGTNLSRHYKRFSYHFGPRKSAQHFYDTLESYRVDYRIDWFGETHMERLPKVPDYPDYWQIAKFLQSKEGDSIITYGLTAKHNSDQRIDLYRLKHGEVVNQARYIAPLGVRYNYAAVSSDKEGNFYLAGNLQLKGNRSSWDYDPNEYGNYNVVLIKVNENGSSREVIKSSHFYLNQSHPKNGLKHTLNFRTSNAQELLAYRISDVQGRTVKEGSGYSGEGIWIGNLSSGLYYFQLWNEDSAYYGQEPFLVNRP